jgi:hypothetical protein
MWLIFDIHRNLELRINQLFFSIGDHNNGLMKLLEYFYDPSDIPAHQVLPQCSNH